MPNIIHNSLHKFAIIFHHNRKADAFCVCVCDLFPKRTIFSAIDCINSRLFRSKMEKFDFFLFFATCFQNVRYFEAKRFLLHLIFKNEISMAIDCVNTQFFCRRPTKKTFFLLLLKKSKSLENRSPNKETEFFDLVDHKS